MAVDEAATDVREAREAREATREREKLDASMQDARRA